MRHGLAQDAVASKGRSLASDHQNMAQTVGMGPIEKGMQKTVRLALVQSVQIDSPAERKPAFGEFAMGILIEPIGMGPVLAFAARRLFRRTLTRAGIFCDVSRAWILRQRCNFRQFPAGQWLGAPGDFLPQDAVFVPQKGLLVQHHHGRPAGCFGTRWFGTRR